jgi:hypothetical protein
MGKNFYGVSNEELVSMVLLLSSNGLRSGEEIRKELLRRLSFSGYNWPDAVAMEDKLVRFDTVIRNAAIEIFGVDVDGDCPVSISITDRTKYERTHWFKVPHEHKCKTSEEKEHLLDVVLTNLAMASETVKRIMDCRRLDRDEAERVEIKRLKEVERLKQEEAESRKDPSGGT